MKTEKITDFKDNSYQFSSDNIYLIDLIRILWYNKLVFSAVLLLFIAIGIIFAFSAKEVFTSSTLFITKTGNSSNSSIANLATLSGILNGFNSSNVDPSDYLDQVIQDKTFLSSVLEKRWFFKNDSLYLYQIFNLEAKTKMSGKELINNKIYYDFIRRNNVLHLFKDSKKGILTLTINSPDPKLSFDINNFVISKLSDYIRDAIQSQAKEKRLFIEKRLKDVKIDLQNSENVLARFKERNVISSSPKVMLEEMRLTRDVTLQQEIYLQLQKQYEMSRIEELDDQTLIQIIRNPEIPLKKSKPNRTQIIFLFFISGIFFGIFSTFTYNYVHRIYVQNFS